MMMFAVKACRVLADEFRTIASELMTVFSWRDMSTNEHSTAKENAQWVTFGICPVNLLPSCSQQ